MKIEWTEPSIVDLQAIGEYIAKDAEYYASRFMDKIIDAVGKLADFPKIGRIVPEAEQENIRELLFYNYRIIYRIEKKQILILTVIHGSRNLVKLNSKPWEII